MKSGSYDCPDVDPSPSPSEPGACASSSSLTAGVPLSRCLLAGDGVAAVGELAAWCFAGTMLPSCGLLLSPVELPASDCLASLLCLFAGDGVMAVVEPSA